MHTNWDSPVAWTTAGWYLTEVSCAGYNWPPGVAETDAQVQLVYLPKKPHEHGEVARRLIAGPFDNLAQLETSIAGFARFHMQQDLSRSVQRTADIRASLVNDVIFGWQTRSSQ